MISKGNKQEVLATSNVLSFKDIFQIAFLLLREILLIFKFEELFNKYPYKQAGQNKITSNVEILY